MADALSPRRHQYVRHYPDWPSSAATAHGRQHYCAVGPVRPLPDKYASATDTNEQTNRQTDGHRRRVNTPLRGFNPSIATLKPQSNGPSYSNTVFGTLAVDGWTVTFGTARRGLGEAVPTSYHSM